MVERSKTKLTNKRNIGLRLVRIKHQYKHVPDADVLTLTLPVQFLVTRNST